MVEALVLLMVLVVTCVIGVMNFGRTVQDAACKPIQIVQYLKPGAPVEEQPVEFSESRWNKVKSCCEANTVGNNEGWGGPRWDCIEDIASPIP